MVKVMAQLPAPAPSVPVQVSRVLAVTVTLPAGVPLLPVTVKTMVTAAPVFDGFGELDVILVVETILVTVSVVAVFVAGPNVESLG